MNAAATIDSFDALMRTLRQDPNHQRVTDIHGRSDIAAICATAHQLWPDQPVLATVQSFDHGDPRIAESGMSAIHVAALFAGRSLQLDIWALDRDNRVLAWATTSCPVADWTMSSNVTCCTTCSGRWPPALSARA